MKKIRIIIGIMILMISLTVLTISALQTSHEEEIKTSQEFFSRNSSIVTYGQFLDELNLIQSIGQSQLEPLKKDIELYRRDKELINLGYANYMEKILQLKNIPLTISQYKQREMYSDYSMIPLNLRTTILKLLDSGMYEAKGKKLDIEGYVWENQLDQYMSHILEIASRNKATFEHQKQAAALIEYIDNSTKDDCITMETYIQGVMGLTTLIADMDQSQSIYDINQFLITLLHYPEYTPYVGGKEGLFWQLATGIPKDNFMQFNNTIVNKPNDMTHTQSLILELSTRLKHASVLDSYSENQIDMKHFMGTIDAMYKEYEMNDSIVGLDYMLTQMAGWGGDLMSLELDLDASRTYENDEIAQLIGTTKSSHFMFSDYAADLDAVNVYQLLKDEKILLSEAIMWYYDSGTYHRERQFLENMGGEQHLANMISMLMTPETVDDTVYQSYGIHKAFYSPFVEDIRRALIKKSGIKSHRQIIKQEYYKKILEAADNNK